MAKKNRNNKGLEGIKEYREDDVTGNKSDEKPSFGEKAKAIRDRFKLGPHHKMERFIATVGVTMTFLLLFTVVAFANHRTDVKEMNTTQALFTQNFSFSLSGESGTVEGIYGNKDRTDVSTLIKLSNPGEMSMNADNYQLFITGQNKMKQEPKVTFALFGSTGYGMVRFQHDEPIEQNILEVTIRSNENLSGRDSENTEFTTDVDDDRDNSYSQHDQARIYINPGAEGVEVFDGYKSGEDDPVKLYMMLVADAQDKEIHSEIKAQEKELEKLLKREKEYSSRLVSSGYVPPEQPWFIKGDYVDDDGVFRPAKNVTRAFVFDYWSNTIHEGYLNQVIDSMSEYNDYMKKQSDVVTNTSTDDEWDKRLDEQMKETVDMTEELEREDGSTLVLSQVETGKSSSTQVAVKESTQMLNSVWQTYIREKSTLQRTLLQKLIVLDADVQSQKEGYSEVTSDKEDKVFFY